MREKLALEQLAVALDAFAAAKDANNGHAQREAETCAANWASILTALMVHAEYEDVRSRRASEPEIKNHIAEALKDMIAARKKGG